MLLLLPHLKTRLQALPALTGWAVRTSTESVERKLVPAVDLRVSGAQVSDRKTGAALVTPAIGLTLVVRKGEQAAAQLDAAFAAVVGSLLNWSIGQVGGRQWEPVSLAQVNEPLLADEGLVAMELVFVTSAKYDGQP